jgi:hypothetical protein
LGQKFEKFYDTGGLGFILRPAPAADIQTTGAPKAVVSLNDLIPSDSKSEKFERLYCFQIATRLAQTVLSFYASPWISDWSLETVQCFYRGGRDTREFFRPHIAVRFGDARNIDDGNRSIEALGYMLLDLGRQVRTRNKSGDDPRVVLDAALNGLQREMGESFRRVVERLIKKWGRSNAYLMEEQNLRGFLSDIEKLKELVRDFTP